MRLEIEKNMFCGANLLPFILQCSQVIDTKYYASRILIGKNKSISSFNLLDLIFDFQNTQFKIFTLIFSFYDGRKIWPSRIIIEK